MKKKEKNTFEKIILWLADRKELIVSLAIGILISALVAAIMWPDRIATLKDGTQPVITFDGNTFTADDLYTEMKKYYEVSILVDMIDDSILTKLYEENDEMLNAVDEEASSYLSYYGTYYGYSEADFLSNFGFTSVAAFKEKLKLGYRRNLAYEEHVKGLITENDINKYYEDKVYGDIDTKHILIKPSTDSSMSEDEIKAKEDEALELAKEIITKLNNGKTFDEVKEEYKDSITYEELGYKAYNTSFDQAYLDEMFALKKGEYSKVPIKSSYGYHIVYKIDEKEKPELNLVKDDVIDLIMKEKMDADNKLFAKALIKLREDHNIKFEDSILNEKYESYKKKQLADS